MIKTDEGKVILSPRPEMEFENEGVLNPACVEKDGVTRMFYRAVRKGNFSTIGCCAIENGVVIKRCEKPSIVPEYRYEKHGVEDPRITFIDDKYYMLYTAYDGKNALVGYATSPDLKTWTKEGILTPQFSYDEAEDIFRSSGIGKKYIFFEEVFKQSRGADVHLWEKDAMLFPKKINGKYAMIHRLLPGIQIMYFDDFEHLTQKFWREYLSRLSDHVLMDPLYLFENAYIGGGAVPIETEKGWLLIYHSVEETMEGQVYHACAALLDINNPQKVLGRLPYPLFSPTHDWEKNGVVNNTVFPTGTSIKDDQLSIYYGAADSRIGVRTVSLSGLINELLL